jgi:Dyp-type peroxidase family
MIINNTEPISKNSTDPQLAMLYSDLQGNILKSHARKHVRLLLIQFTGTPAEAKDWVTKQMLPKITSFTQQMRSTFKMKAIRMEADDPGFCSFSLSQKGYHFLGLNPQLDDASFNKGAGAGTITNDPAKNKWETPYQKDIHAVIILGTTHRPGIQPLSDSIQKTFGNTVKLLIEEKGEALPKEIEPFGFADGISQPRFFTEDMADEVSTKNWDPFASLDLALVKDPLGKAFKDNDVPVGQGGAYSYGSYLVYRKLEQDVAGWNAEVVKNSSTLKLDPNLFAAFAVGRFKDGTPVINTDHPEDVKPFPNDFNYDNDQDGLKCPYHAHIRKANPRGDSRRKGATLEEEKRRRISRRAIPFKDDHNKEGLLFMCYQSSIVNQFEFMQNHWIDEPNFANAGTGEDSVIAEGATAKKAWPAKWGGPGTNQLEFKHFVSMRGGEYFFTPSISALNAL